MNTSNDRGCSMARRVTDFRANGFSSCTWSTPFVFPASAKGIAGNGAVSSSTHAWSNCAISCPWQVSSPHACMTKRPSALSSISMLSALYACPVMAVFSFPSTDRGLDEVILLLLFLNVNAKTFSRIQASIDLHTSLNSFTMLRDTTV